MKNPFIDFDGAAIAPMLEPLKWTQDKYPHNSGMIDAVVLQGSPETASAGVSIDYLTADSWSVHAPLGAALVDQVREGDTLERGIWKTMCLTVQRSMLTDTGWWLLCTASQRAPAS